jgi:hypothetical protein
VLLGVAVASNRFGVDVGVASIQSSLALTVCPSAMTCLVVSKIVILRRLKKEQQAENAADAEEKSE